MTSKKNFPNVPAIITTAAQLHEMAAVLERASRAQAEAKAWKEAAARTIADAIDNGEAFEDVSDNGRILYAGIKLDGIALIEKTVQNATFNSAEAKKLLTPAQIEACTRYGSRTSYEVEAV